LVSLIDFSECFVFCKCLEVFLSITLRWDDCVVCHLSIFCLSPGLKPGSPWENGYIESFNGKLRDELLDREIFDKLKEAQVLSEWWRRSYNTIRPRSSLGPASRSRGSTT
jgi:hypothetical protein